mmetsp:Transcript_19719/g.36332  ORF Transcript_19719/g.36332 Transcript_19719/m.36332 type:complete len:276 (-) Transcript_19719:4192-5019(-)
MPEAKHFFSGAFAATASAVILQPFDVLRTHMVVNPNHTRISTVLQTIYKMNGTIGFWKGTQSTVLRAFFGAGLNFLLIEELKLLLQSDNSGILKTFGSDTIASAIAKSTVLVLVSPINVIKVRMEAPESNAYKSFYDAVKCIKAKEGYGGFYKGLLTSYMRDVPYAGLVYGTFCQYQRIFEPFTPYYNVAAGSLAGITATFLTQPFDLLRVRFQYAYLSSVPEYHYTSILQAFRTIYHSEGLKGFYHGVIPRVSKKGVSGGLFFSAYEHLKSVFN